MTRIAYVIGDLHLGGAEKLVTQLAIGLDSDPEFSCCVCCLGSGGEYATQLTQRGIKLYVIEARKESGLRGLTVAFGIIRKLVRIFIREKIDIVHTYLFYTGILGRVAARLAGVPVVLHTFFRIFYCFQPLIELFLSIMTDHFVVDSCAARDLIAKKCKIRLRKIVVIYNGIDFSALDRQDKSYIRHQLTLQQAKYVMGIIAHLNPAKGHSYYLKAFARVLVELPDTWLLIVGDGELRQKLESESRELYIDHRVLFLGYRSDLASILASLDLLVLPSAWEGFGIVQAEAMYLGIPVLGTNVGGAREVVRAFKTGFLVPYGDVEQLADATVLLLKDQWMRAEMGMAGRERVLQLFSMDRMLNDYRTLYRKHL